MKKILIDSISYYYEEGSSYGLKILMKFRAASNYLLFDSSKFIFVNKDELVKYSEYNWKEIFYDSLKNDLYIDSIREDELVSYFVKFSNNDIFYIFQRIDSLDKWEQDFEIINANNSKYSEIENYRNESWIDEIQLES